MQEEIFGPILPVLTYRTIDEAIARVNASPRPLALYYFGGDDADRRKVLSRTASGNVGINNTLMHYAQDDLPFGGVGPSGLSRDRRLPAPEPRQGRLRSGLLERGQSLARAVRTAGRCDPCAVAAIGRGCGRCRRSMPATEKRYVLVQRSFFSSSHRLATAALACSSVSATPLLAGCVGPICRLHSHFGTPFSTSRWMRPTRVPSTTA